jgi:hypothetical protein
MVITGQQATIGYRDREAIGPGRPGEEMGVADGDHQALAWLEQVTRIDRVPIPWRDMVRVTISVVTPLAAALTVRDAVPSSTAVGAGIVATTGALVGAIAPKPGPLREKLRRTGAGVGFAAVGLVVGQYAAGGGWQPVLVIAAFAALAAAISAVSEYL